MLTWRPASPAEPGARLLWDEYQALVGERLGPSFVPTSEIFATEADFAAFVLAEDGAGPVACGGVVLDGDGTRAELKRMFVSERGRGRGTGRALLARLERRARELGAARARLLTTEVLGEARALYASAGYRVEEVRNAQGRLDLVLVKALD